MRKIKIAGHSPDNSQLLKVFLAKKGGIGPYLIEQFCNHGRYAIKMSGPRSPAQSGTDSAHADIGGEAIRIDLIHSGCPEQFYASLFQQSSICGFLPWIAVEIFTCTELCRVNENGNYYLVTLPHRGLHQLHVPGMQSAHRWDQPYSCSVFPYNIQGCAERVKLSDNLHR